MRGYPATTARHDAEWMLQHQKTANDHLSRKQPRQQPSWKKKTSTTVQLRIIRPPSLSPAERLQAAAAAVGATQAELDMVADMLGLTDVGLVSTYTAKGDRQRLVAPCPTCGRPYIQLRVDMRFISHPRESHQPINDDTRCPGSGQMSDRAKCTTPPPPTVPKPVAVVPALRQPAPPALPDQRAACQDHDRELFYPLTYGPHSAVQVADAKRVCRRCPLQAACLRYALDNGEMTYGIWGGTTPNERKALAGKAAA